MRNALVETSTSYPLDQVPRGAYCRGMQRTVSTASLFDTRYAVADIIDEYHRQTGIWCTEPEALAAAYSVPDGAPIELALVNVGCAMDDVQIKHFENMRAGVRNFCKRP